MRLLITAITTAILVCSAIGEDTQLKRVLVQDESSSHNDLVKAAVQDQIADSIIGDNRLSSIADFEPSISMRRKRSFIEKKRIMMYDCMNSDNQIESVLFSKANSALIHACFAIGEAKNSTSSVSPPVEVTKMPFTAPPPYYAWNIENKSPRHKKKSSGKSAATKIEEGDDKMQQKFVITRNDCQMLGVMTRDSKDKLLYPCEKQWHIES